MVVMVFFCITMLDSLLYEEAPAFNLEKLKLMARMLGMIMMIWILLGWVITSLKYILVEKVDTTNAPKIGYGVREPWNSRMISEKGSWSSDGKIFTVSHDVNVGSSDGINRISVWGVKDLNGWIIPTEFTRFNILIQSAGSASTGFSASPGLGEVSLAWDSPSESDLADVLGYNMYRYEAITDTTYSNPVKINESLITEIKYKDYDVERLKQYYYKYKVLTTNLTENRLFKNSNSRAINCRFRRQ